MLNITKSPWKIISGIAMSAIALIIVIIPRLFSSHSSHELIFSTLFFVSLFICTAFALLKLLRKESNQDYNDLLLHLENQKVALNAHSLVSMSDKQGVITYVNDKFCQVSGYTKAELIGRKHSVLNSNNQPKSYWRTMHQTVLSGNIWRDDVRNRAKDGSYYWVDTTIVPNVNAAKEVIGFTSICTDITQQQANLESLELAQRQTESAKLALDQHSLVSVADLDGTITYVNDKFVSVSGYHAHELIGKKHSLLNSSNQRKGYWRAMHEHVITGNVWHDEVRNRAKDGSYYWVDTTIVPNVDRYNKVIGFTSIRTDITQQKEIVESLALAKKQAESAKFALDQHSLVSMADIDGIITYVNNKFVDVSGYHAHELIGKKHSILNSNNQRKDYWQAMHEQVLKGEVWKDEVRNRAKDGNYYWVDTTIVPNIDKNNQVIGFTSIRTDITHQKENLKKLQLANVQAESAKFALDQHSLVSVAQLDGTITYVNEKFVAVSGYRSDELLGKKHNILNSNNQRKDYWQKMHEHVIAGKVWHDKVRNRAKDGSYYWVDTTIVPDFDKDNKVTGFISIRTDITHQIEIQESLAIAKEQAEVASVSKADFLANMSHEIRTPMNGVIGMTNLLLNGELNKEQHRLAATVKSSAVGLLSIINDILDFSKVEAGKLDLELIPFNLGQMIEDVGTAMSFQSQRKNLQLICPATPLIQQWVTADPGRIRQVLTNLIGNAIKFTEHGEIAVFVNIIEETADHKVFRFEIKDTGIGIDESKQKILFDKFSQADTSTTRKYGGTGLGLSICKSLVELMNGEIGVISRQGKGSTFWFTLPLANASMNKKAPTYNTDVQSERILIVDDNETNLELMHQLHKIWGIPHTLVTSARAALIALDSALAENTPYSIAILDMNMPDTSGLELCRQLQLMPEHASTKLIMASSRALRGDAPMMKEAGFQGYVTKPIQQSELFDVLLMVSGLKEQAPDFITRHSTKEHMDFQGHVLVVEDNPTNQLVIEGLLRTLGITVDLAANGEEAIAALKNISRHDLVFMDCQMPILDGYQATKQIRASKASVLNNQIPIIAMTANAMAGDKQKCLNCGMDDYLSKPIEPKSVIDALKRWLPKTSKRKQSLKRFVPAVPNEGNQPELTIFDVDDMACRLMNDSSLMNSVADVFYQDIDEQIDELKQSVAQNNIKEATATAHKIKGAAANVGGVALSALALTLEQAGKAQDLDKIAKNIEKLEQYSTELRAAMERALSKIT